VCRIFVGLHTKTGPFLSLYYVLPSLESCPAGTGTKTRWGHRAGVPIPLPQPSSFPGCRHGQPDLCLVFIVFLELHKNGGVEARGDAVIRRGQWVGLSCRFSRPCRTHRLWRVRGWVLHERSGHLLPLSRWILRNTLPVHERHLRWTMPCWYANEVLVFVFGGFSFRPSAAHAALQGCGAALPLATLAFSCLVLGYYCDAGSVSNSQRPCPVGKWSDAGAASCSPCAAGKPHARLYCTANLFTMLCWCVDPITSIVQCFITLLSRIMTRFGWLPCGWMEYVNVTSLGFDCVFEWH
jgi:hypothetical protein